MSVKQLDYVPAKVQVLRHVRVKYACPGCEQCVKTAALPEHILPKTDTSPGLLAQLVTSKYAESVLVPACKCRSYPSGTLFGKAQQQFER